MKKQPYCFPLSIQITLPDNYREESDFQQNLEILQDSNFYGVELNITDPSRINILDLQSFLQEFNLKMTMFASGLTAKTFNLSLSTNDDNNREKSIAKCIEIIDFVTGTEAGIIIGFLKGGIIANAANAKKLFLHSIAEIGSYAAKKTGEDFSGSNK